MYRWQNKTALTKDGEKISNCKSLATYIKGRGTRDGNAYLQTDVYQTASVKSEEEIPQQGPEEKWGGRAVGSLQSRWGRLWPPRRAWLRGQEYLRHAHPSSALAALTSFCWLAARVIPRNSLTLLPQDLEFPSMQCLLTESRKTKKLIRF